MIKVWSTLKWCIHPSYEKQHRLNVKGMDSAVS